MGGETMRQTPSGNAAYPCLFLCALLGACSPDSGAPPDRAKVSGDAGAAAIGAPLCEPAQCASLGGFTPPFVEPHIDPAGAAAPASPDINPRSTPAGADRCLYGQDGPP